MNLDEYRYRVITTVACPYCKANIRQGCRKSVRFMLRKTHRAVSYVHDDRSALYEDHVLWTPVPR